MLNNLSSLIQLEAAWSCGIPVHCLFHVGILYSLMLVQNYGPQHVCLLPFLTHFADLSSWEYAKKLKPIIPQVEALGVQASHATVQSMSRYNCCRQAESHLSCWDMIT